MQNLNKKKNTGEVSDREISFVFASLVPRPSNTQTPPVAPVVKELWVRLFIKLGLLGGVHSGVEIIHSTTQYPAVVNKIRNLEKSSTGETLVL
jgi:hypothetical protein